MTQVIPFTFATQSGSVPASELDNDFTAIQTSLTTEASIATASTIDLGAQLSNNIIITGDSGSITSFGSSAITAQPLFFVRFTGTGNSIVSSGSISTPGSTNISVNVGDEFKLTYLGGGNWKVQPFSSSSSGGNIFNGGTTGGSANAQTATATGFTLAAGNGVICKIGNSNTNAMTLNISSTGVKNVYIPTASGPIACVGGEAIANNESLFVYDGTQYQLINAANVAFTRSFISADQTITSAGLLTIPHGLGIAPKIIQPSLKCVNTSQGWAPGDIVPWNNHIGDTTATPSRGQAIYFDATNIYVRFGSAGNVFTLLNKGTGAENGVVNTDWSWFISALA